MGTPNKSIDDYIDFNESFSKMVTGKIMISRVKSKVEGIQGDSVRC